jgi:hypothetical protein
MSTMRSDSLSPIREISSAKSSVAAPSVAPPKAASSWAFGNTKLSMSASLATHSAEVSKAIRLTKTLP